MPTTRKLISATKEIKQTNTDQLPAKRSLHAYEEPASGLHLPESMDQQSQYRKVRVYFSAENLFTISGIADMFDPEAIAANGWSSGKTYPLSQTFSFGINVTL